MQSVSAAAKEHYSEDESPDPNTDSFEVCGYQILVKPICPEKKTKGGIILTDNYRDSFNYISNIGRVLSMGPLCYNDKEKFGEPWCAVGDYVITERNVGQKFRLQDVPVTLVGDHQIRMRVKSAKDVDQLFSVISY